MLIFATSDKGGTGRSVTSSNVLYRSALQGSDVCYLDFDFGSPTAGSIFNINHALRGTTRGGLHSYLDGAHGEPQRIDVWAESDRPSLRDRPPGAGRLVLLPGDSGGGEFPTTRENIERCARLFLRLEEEFDVTLVDLSAGRSYATEIVLAATARAELRSVRWRWLVFHRWTRQHVLAASGLVHGQRGIVETGIRHGHDRTRLTESLRFVRTAVVDPDSPELEGLQPAQLAWLRACNQDLLELASRERVGRTLVLGSVPLDPVLQWREQLISDNDVWARRIANRETVEAFDSLAKRIVDDTAWETL
ncbi:SCO2523 family variant P-loop protein [Micromonospora echinofusca]|uniref:ParA family protein n=1 Tax=Micromonospora echinofusca TaxID=47858 RepID=A0ABS3VKW8_MICEH|nr:SCO2523 family variant P-loop protein [Micromonospora echinofusca]MBO4205172.1 ParA family protein [Micromonospora echinofusca]